MLGALVRRGLLAGLLAGILAGVVGLVIGEPSIDAAVALEQSAAASPASASAVGTPAGAGAAADDVAFSRSAQKAGLVLGTGLVGIGVGAMFAIAAAWSVGRVRGDEWQRSLRLGVALVAAVVLLPALAYPPLPPGGGDPESVGTRSALYLGTAVVGVLLAGAGRALAALLARSPLAPARRQVAVGAALAASVAVLLAVLPEAGSGDGLPAELLWSFRLSSVATQVVLWGGTAVVFGLLSPERGQSAP